MILEDRRVRSSIELCAHIDGKDFHPAPARKELQVLGIHPWLVAIPRHPQLGIPKLDRRNIDVRGPATDSAKSSSIGFPNGAC